MAWIGQVEKPAFACMSIADQKPDLERQVASSSRPLFFNYLISNGNFSRCNPDHKEKSL